MRTSVLARVSRLLAGSLLVVACAAPSDATREAPGAAEVQAVKQQLIEHQVPRRDFVGPQPARFAWTPAKGADHYAIGIWNEVDRLIWRKDDISGPSVDRPADLDFEPGTYFWTVSGLTGANQEIAKSGLSAFVVE